MRKNLLRKSAIAVFTLTTASFYFAQEQETTSKDIEEVVLVGVADIAKDRKTPVAVSTIKESAIVEKLGNQEFPEILNTTPSVYATKSGGGFGDSKINIRGFSQENIAVMVNGIPINDMEGGSIYWSNWSGISDVTSAIQVQRGLGASKLAIASVGGTINIVTRASDKKQGGTLTVGIGNDGYHKSLFAYNTGKSAKGWSSSILMSRTAGAMYADGTDFEGYNYYFALGYQPNKKHDFQLTVTGAPQWHHQRLSSIKISDAIKYGNGVDKPNRRYNADWGYLMGADGVAREYSWRRNFYHKPIASLNWDWKMSPKSKLSTVFYASFAWGGGSGSLGSIPNKSLGSFREDGIYNFNKIIEANENSTPQQGQIIRRTTINAHNWAGILSNYQHNINKNWNISVGVDGRYFKGYHYVIASDLLGASGYIDKKDKNNPIRIINNAYSESIWNPLQKKHSTSDRIDRNYDGEVIYYGSFAQAEYTNDHLSAFVQGSISHQQVQRIDYFIIDGVTKSRSGDTMNRKTGFKNSFGYNIKGGVNYNFNKQHNIFGNIGYYSRQPFFVATFSGNENTPASISNEKILGIELGYGFRSNSFNANVNLYRTSWDNRYLRTIHNDTNPSKTRYYVDITGLNEIHQGIEIDASYKVNKILTANAMFSIGDWFYKGNTKAEALDESYQPYTPTGQLSNKYDLFLDKVKVGDTSHLSSSLGITIEPISNLKFDANWRYVDNLYARLDVYSFSNKERAKKGVMKLPSYNLLDLGLSYKLNIGNKQSFTFRGNIYNVLDKTYIAESTTNIIDGDKGATNKKYKGIDTGNQVFFGYGRTWNASVTFNF